MLLVPLRWLGKNLGTLILSFLLALVVWVSAVTAANPNKENEYPRPVPIEIIGQDSDLLLMGDIPTSVKITLNAPNSVWTQLISDEHTIRAWVDLSGLGAGRHTVPVQVQVSLRPVRVVSVDPKEIGLTLEPLVTRVLTINLQVKGEPPQGYKADAPTMNPGQVSISGPDSLVSKVKEVKTTLNIAGATEKVVATLPLAALDANGASVKGITLTPDSMVATQPIELLGGYRNVIVKVVTTGQVANGYKLTNIFVNPPNVIVFSSDPRLVDALPGYVETKPLDLANAEYDFERLVEIDLPKGISVVGDPKVLVQVSIAPIESSLTVSLHVEITGLTPGLLAEVAPTTVDVILSGPVPVLNTLKPSDLRVKVDLTGFGVGTHQIIPVVDLLPPRVQVVSILPATVEVVIVEAPTPTPTPTPVPTPTITPTPKP